MVLIWLASAPTISSGVNGTDGFFTKLNPTGSALVYSTYLGGTDLDLGLGIALDANTLNRTNLGGENKAH